MWTPSKEVFSIPAVSMVYTRNWYQDFLSELHSYCFLSLKHIAPKTTSIIFTIMYSVPVNIIDTWKSEYFGQSELTPIFQIFLPSSGCWIEGILPVWCFRHSPCWWHHIISFVVLLCRYHYCPDHDYSQHHSPEISAQGLLCHSNGSLRICLLHLCVLCFGGVWHPALFCQQSETKQGQRQKEEKTLYVSFPVRTNELFMRKDHWVWCGFGLVNLPAQWGSALCIPWWKESKWAFVQKIQVYLWSLVRSQIQDI